MPNFIYNSEQQKEYLNGKADAKSGKLPPLTYTDAYAHGYSREIDRKNEKSNTKR